MILNKIGTRMCCFKVVIFWRFEKSDFFSRPYSHQTTSYKFLSTFKQGSGSPSNARSYRWGIGEKKCEKENLNFFLLLLNKISFPLKKFVVNVIGKVLNFSMFGNMHWRLPTCFFFQFVQEEPSPDVGLGGPSDRGGNVQDLSPSDAAVGPKPSAGSRHNQREEPSPTMGFLHPKEEASEKEVP